MTERKANVIVRLLSPRKTHGYAFLTRIEAERLRGRREYHRNNYRHKKNSGSTEQLVQPAIDKFENSNPEEQEAQLRKYVKKAFRKATTVLPNFDDSKPSPDYPNELVDWAFPKPLIVSLDKMADQGKLDRNSLVTSILSDAIGARDNN